MILRVMALINGVAWLVMMVWMACQPASTCHRVSVAPGVGGTALIVILICAAGMFLATIWDTD
jgi:hypothetical protein